MGLTPETGYLFAGPPRTGKTHMAEALAGSVQKALKELGSIEAINFMVVTPTLFKSIGTQPGESRVDGIKNLLIGAQGLAPVVIFIDEFDLGGWQRERDSDALGELLDAMSTLNKDKIKKVVVIAATNSPNTIDIALRSPGRFGKTLYFTYPNVQERLEFLHREMVKRAVVITEELAQVLQQIARETEGSSYDALSRVVITALLQANMRNSALQSLDFEMALDLVIRKLQPAVLESLSAEEQRTIATHLAGHAVAMHALKARNIVTKATIFPIAPKIKEEVVWEKYNQNKQDNSSNNIDRDTEFQYGKIFTLRSEKDKLPSERDLIIKAKVQLAGHIAESVVFNSCGYTYHNRDEVKAFEVAKKITFAGINAENLTKKMNEEYLMRSHALFDEWKKEVTMLLQEHKAALELLALGLYNHKSIPGEIIAAIMHDPNNEELKTILHKTQAELMADVQKAYEQEHGGIVESETVAPDDIATMEESMPEQFAAA